MLYWTLQLCSCGWCTHSKLLTRYSTWIKQCTHDFQSVSNNQPMLHIHMVCFLGACDGLIRDIDVIHEMLSMQTTCTTCKHVLNLPQEVCHEKAFLSIHLSNVMFCMWHQTLGLMQVTTAIFLSDLCFMTIYQTCKQCAHHVNIYLWTQAGRTCPKNYCEKVFTFQMWCLGIGIWLCVWSTSNIWCKYM